MPLLDVIMGNISIEEVTKSIHAPRNNKAGGIDEVTAELIKHGGKTVASHPHNATERGLGGLRREVSMSWKLHVKQNT